MSEQAKQYRAAMRAKAQRLGGDMSAGKVDASDFGPVEGSDPLNADVKTGLRPVSKRAFARGGAVSGGEHHAHGGRAGRKAGGGTPKRIADEISMNDIKDANKSLYGSKHVGGVKDGGKVKKAGGGPLGGFNAVSSPQQAAAVEQANQNVAGVAPQRMQFGAGAPGILHVKKGGKVEHPHKAEDEACAKKLARHHRAAGGGVDPDEAEDKADQAAQAEGKKNGGGVYAPNIKLGPRETVCSGGRTARASGGKAGKGKTNINIIIGAHPGGGEQPQGGAPMPPPPRPIPPPMMPPAPPPGGPPQMGGPAGGGAPPPMPMPPPGMPRSTGGRAYPIDTGAGGGKARLAKIRAYGLKPAGD
jgi:hypothetical protein